MTTILFASDHAGYGLKSALMKKLSNEQYNIIDLGTDSTKPVDYPDYANKMATEFKKFVESAVYGVLICGSGIGVSIVANRHQNIRAALCFNPEITALSRQHNNANIICFGAKFIDCDSALECISIFLNTKFSNEKRHHTRIKKILLS